MQLSQVIQARPNAFQSFPVKLKFTGRKANNLLVPETMAYLDVQSNPLNESPDNGSIRLFFQVIASPNFIPA